MEPRLTIGLADEWRFQVDAEGRGMDEEWYKNGLPQPRSVFVPHTWNVETGLEEYRGTAWYEYDLELASDWRGKLLRLQFDAVYRDAVIWLNGSQIGTHQHSGYTSFLLDISEYAHYGVKNRLVVSVSNVNCERALPSGNSFDWADDGGIIRGVSLLVSGAVALDYVKLDALPIFAESMAEAKGRLLGEAVLWKQGLQEVDTAILSVTVSHQGTVVKSETYAADLHKGRLTLRSMEIESVRLWHFDHPHLYEVAVDLKVNDTLMDRIVANVGFRELKTEGNQLLLNREPIRLMGVEWMPGSHPDHGMAEARSDMVQVLEQIKQANCVITRFHWQQDSQLLDWCDRNGLLVQEEIPHWQQPSEPDEAALLIAKQHADEMISRHYNHPSLFAWGMGNELNGQDERTTAYMEQLKAYIHTLDRQRCINYVSNSVHIKPTSDATGAGDMIMWNDYIGTWHGELDIEEVIASIEQAYPKKPIVVAEFGLCEPAFTGGDERRVEILRQKTAEYRKHAGIAALIFFSLNDYRTQMGEEGTGRLRQRVHGTTDLYGNPRPSYQALREVGSPIIMKSVHTDEQQLSIVLAATADIPSYTVSGYKLTLRQSGGEEITAAIPVLAPGEKCQLSIPLAGRPGQLLYNIERPTGFSVIEGIIQD